MSCLWRVDKHYETFPVDLLDWYNASFDVAMEEGNSDHGIATLARDFHYQLLYHLYQTEAFCDVTLACDNTSIKCHKMILSACSSYFQTLFMENTCEHPIVFLKDIKIGEVRAILDYMYKGEVNVAQEELPGTT